jgi:hypothetical protein
MSSTYGPDERFRLDSESDEAMGVIVSADDVEPDIISDPGVEGGVDAPNEEPEEPEAEI